MVTLDDIRGQPRAVARLRRALDQGRVAHAYLFCGPRGSGKFTTGLALAAALNCERAPGRGCPAAGDADADASRGDYAACSACDKIAGGRHPDVQILERQGAAQIIPIETIRSQVIPQLGLPPHEGRARVFLVEESAALLDPSANALLKTLEEPPPRTHFVLCTTSPDQLLPTIRSRCQRVSFGALPAALRAELDAGDEEAARLAELAQTLRAAMDERDVAAVYVAAGDVSAQRQDVAPALERLAETLHAEARSAALARESANARRLGAQAALALETHFAVTQHNAAGQLALEAMLHQMRAVGS